MIDMKKKMAIVLSAVLACSMSITAMAAPSPTIAQDTVQNVTVNTSISTMTGAPQVTGIVGASSAVLNGTIFRDAACDGSGRPCRNADFRRGNRGRNEYGRLHNLQFYRA